MFQNNIIPIIVNGAVVDIHKHTCIQLVISLDKPFDCLIGDSQLLNMEGFIINSGIKHSCNAPDTNVIVFLIEPESIIGWQLKAILAANNFVDITTLLLDDEIKKLKKSLSHDKNVNDKILATEAILQSIIPNYGALHHEQISKERIQIVIDYIIKNLHEQILLEDVAATIFLSPERTRHLFVQQMGLPFTQYLIWKRIQQVIIAVVKNKVPLKDAAIDCGFSHQSHFCRVFKKMFGVAPKPFLQNSRSVQFLIK